MLGLMVLLAIGIYLILTIIVVAKSVQYARRQGKNAARWGWGALLVMYLIPFWDWIPTVLAHKYYCATEAGFWVYKTLDEWEKENLGVMDTLVAYKGEPMSRDGDMNNHVDTYYVNQRFNYVSMKNGPLLFNRWRWERQLIDSSTKEVLSRYVDYSTGNGHIGGELELQFWLYSDFCAGGRERAIQIGKLINQVKGMRK